MAPSPGRGLDRPPAGSSPPRGSGSTARSRLICLLPVRNGSAHLPGYFESVSRFADGVVALDDGSTDDTLRQLRAEPLVNLVLTNPPRPGFLGWNDGENRNRLLAAAAELEPDWVLFLDVDERIDPSDGAALRRFVDHDALRGCAYGFQLYRMLEGESFDPDHQWVYRLFSYSPTQRVPDRRLDFIPVPEELGAARVYTTLRIQHLAERTPAEHQRRLAKYAQADPTGRFSAYTERIRRWSPDPTRPYPRWQDRPADLPVLADPTTAPGRSTPAAPMPSAPPGRSAAAGTGPTLVCLLPARNCLDDLPGWFESVKTFADAVVALDDGSTDGTGAYLAEQPLVEVLLTNERRSSYAGWDDATNRNRLLAAAGELRPGWMISLDADERIPLDDAGALRRFVLEEAVPGFAYGLARYRMVGDLRHYDELEYVAWRLFSWTPGQRFGDERLHLTPIPLDIPRSRRIETTFRIQHLAGLNDARRRSRWVKYEEADPERVWEPDYEYVRRPPGRRYRWPERAPGLAAVLEPANPEVRRQWDLAHLGGPVMSVAVLSGAATRPEDVAATLDSLPNSAGPEDLEVVVVGPLELAAISPGRPNTAIRVIPNEAGQDAAAVANAALRASRGDYVLFLPAGSVVERGTLGAVLEAHERGFAVVGGRARGPGSGRLGQAAFFLDHSASLPSLPSGPLELAPAAGSAARDALLRAGGFSSRPGPSFPAETLGALGYRSWRADLDIALPPVPSTWLALFRDQFRAGQELGSALGSLRSDAGATTQPRGPRARLARYGLSRSAAIRRQVARGGPAAGASFRRVWAPVTLGVGVRWLGLLVGYFASIRATPVRWQGRPGADGAAWGSPHNRARRRRRSSRASPGGGERSLLPSAQLELEEGSE